MNVTSLVIPLIALTACSGPRGCSAEKSNATDGVPDDAPAKAVSPTPEALVDSTAERRADQLRSQIARLPVDDPQFARRASLLTQISKLTDGQCDEFVLLFRLIPRDEILERLSEPRNDLVHYVMRSTTRPEELGDLERAIKDRNKPTREQRDAWKRAREDRAR